MSSRFRSRRSPRPSGLPRLRAHWVRPEIVVQVGFIEWTVHGKLRHPRLLGVRIDKAAREVVQGDGVITHPEKVLFPERRDHQRRAGRLLRSDRTRHVAAYPRPADHDGALSAGHRPEGLLSEGRVEGFSGVARARRGPEEGRHRAPSARQRHALLLWLANQNCITPHVWTSRAPDCTTRTSASSTSIRREDEPRRVARRSARASRLARRARPAELGQDIRLEGLPHRRSARRQVAAFGEVASSRTRSARCS